MRLQKLREYRGLSKSAVGRAVGVTRQAIFGYENGSREPDIRMLTLLADFFGCSIDYLVEHDIDLPAGFSFHEMELIRNFRLLPEDDKEEILAVIAVKLSRLKRDMSGAAV